MTICVLDPNKDTFESVLELVQIQNPSADIKGFSDFFNVWKFIVLNKPEKLYTKVNVPYKTGYEIASMIKSNNYLTQTIFISEDGKSFV